MEEGDREELSNGLTHCYAPVGVHVTRVALGFGDGGEGSDPPVPGDLALGQSEVESMQKTVKEGGV